MNHRAKKSLGQNFLKSKSALRAMVESGNVQNSDTVLEIGPGKGALTEYLLQSAQHVIAVEKDRELVTLLTEKFSEDITSGKLTLIEEDILNIDPDTLLQKPYKIVANIPYNITGLLIQKFLTAKHQPEHMVLLVQKEVADRIISNDKKESILSISVKAYGVPKKILKVPAESFSPAPKVDSAIISIQNISREFFDTVSEENFFHVVKTGFAHKRKLLSRNLTDLGIPHDTIIKTFDLLSLSKNTRSESVPLLTWKELAKNLLS